MTEENITQIAELEQSLSELAEVAYRADKNSKSALTEIRDINASIKDAVGEVSTSVTSLRRDVTDISQRLVENSDIDKEQRRSLTDLNSSVDKILYDLKGIESRLSPADNRTLESLHNQVAELEELLEGDKDDETIPSYRRFRADAASVFRSVLGDGKTIKSLDAFRNEYYVSLNQREGIGSIIGAIGPYALSALVALAGYAVFDRFDSLEEFQQATQSRVQQLEYRVGNGDSRGTLGEQVDEVEDLTLEIEREFRELSVELVLKSFGD